MITTAISPTVSMRRLEWDSLHFGVPVAELSSPDLNDEDLRGVLTAARTDGLHLIYWATHRERTLPPDLLCEFHGLAVNHRVKFVAALNDPPLAREPARSVPYRIGEFPRGTACRELLDLAIVAGRHSRFQVDRRIPNDKFCGLYETWMNRSTLRELADVVLVATPPAAEDEFVGMITLSETAGAGKIGLIGVRDDHRGQGVAAQLITAACNWLRRRGASKMSVVTQLENRAECELYSRWKYGVVEVRHWFHFRPQGDEDFR